VFASPNGCNDFRCTLGSNRSVYEIARKARDAIQGLGPRLRGDDEKEKPPEGGFVV
jgi:hypothetical protein